MGVAEQLLVVLTGAFFALWFICEAINPENRQPRDPRMWADGLPIEPFDPTEILQ